VLVEDNLRNLQTAKSVFGMTTVLVQKASHADTCHDDASIHADRVIDDILQLEQVLGER
jgi:FMN phosphatase YigB (HAD superfamily)